jgi:hypothetical protein
VINLSSRVTVTATATAPGVALVGDLPMRGVVVLLIGVTVHDRRLRAAGDVSANCRN